jgi:hypothetical protein
MDGVGLAGILVLVWAFWRINEFDAFVYRGGFVLVDLATLAIIASLVHSSSHLERFLGVAPLVWLGQRSYGIYLWHWPIFQLTRPGIDLQWPPLAITMLRVGLTLAAAAASYRWIEQPIRHGALSRRWAENPTRRRADTNAAIGAGLTIGMILALGPIVRPDHSVDELQRAARAAGTSDELSLEDLVGSTSPTTTTIAPTTTLPPETTLAPTTVVADPAVATPPPTTAAPTTTVPAPTTTLSPAGIRVTAIGDSVMLAAKRLLQAQIPQIAVDAKVSRQFGEAGPQAMRLAAFGALGPVVVVHLGTNGPMSQGQLDRLIASLGPDRRIVLVTAHVPRPWEALTNQRIREAPGRWSNVSVADWNALSAPHPDWFVHDGTHLQRPGEIAYMDLIRSAVQ